MVQVVFLGHGALGDEDWKTREGTGGEHRGSHTAAIDCALAESAGGAGGAPADEFAPGPWRNQQPRSAALSPQATHRDHVAPPPTNTPSGWRATNNTNRPDPDP